ncbi:MAG: hypothetical protein E4G98_06565 [Promethearchaeota archaeon]|nr:MAG: hypothetical protein E4G98_06565 [Candidatus Lokiarchaeota archaeon]
MRKSSKDNSRVKLAALMILVMVIPEMIYMSALIGDPANMNPAYKKPAYQNAESLSTSISSPLPSATECVDAWILIGGDRADHEAWPQILTTLNWVYLQLLAMGTPQDDIKYLVAEVAEAFTMFENGVSSDANIENAFKVWAPSKVSATGTLGVYILDHGGTNTMANYPYSFLTASELDQLLDDFETASGCNRIFVVYEACESGTFLDELSQDNRIIMTSTEPGHSSWLSPYEPHRAMFAEGFFASLRAGNSLGDAFVHASDVIDFCGYGDQQKPCIDDDHNGVGHVVNAWGDLPSSWDGIDAKDTYITTGCPDFLIQITTAIFIPKKIWVTYNPTSISVPITVAVENTTFIPRVICRVIPEDWNPPDPKDNETMGKWSDEEDLYQWDLYPDGSGNFTGRFVIYNPVSGVDYRITCVADDGEHDDGMPMPVSTSLGTTADGTPPADTVAPTVAIIDPYEEEVVSGNITITAQGEDENSGLESIELYVDDELVSTTAMPDYLPYPNAAFTVDTSEYRNGELNITAKATDNAGNSFSHSIMVEVNNTRSGLLDFLPFDIPVEYQPYIIGGVIGLVGLTIIVGIARKRKKK